MSKSMKSQIRMALLKGERLSNRQVPGRFGVSVTALNDAVQDLRRVGYNLERSEGPDAGAVWWVTNPKHIPKTDSGSTRTTRRRNASPAKPAIGLGQDFKVVQIQLEDDDTVTYQLVDELGRRLSAVEA